MQEDTEINQSTNPKKINYLKIAFIISVAINIMFAINITLNITGFSIGNQTNNNIQTNAQDLQKQITDLTSQLSKVQSDRDLYKGQLDIANANVADLQNKLDLSIITVSGSVKTSSGTYPTTIIFDDGSSKQVVNVNSGSYVANIPNNHIYTITVTYTAVIIPSPLPCTPNPNQLSLYVTDKDQRLQTHNWEC